MVRLKYNYNSLTGWYYTDPIITGNTSCIAFYRNLEYRIRSYDNDKILCEGTCKSNALLKKKIKQELIDMGAIFEDEIRGIK